MQGWQWCRRGTGGDAINAPSRPLPTKWRGPSRGEDIRSFKTFLTNEGSRPDLTVSSNFPELDDRKEMASSRSSSSILDLRGRKGDSDPRRPPSIHRLMWVKKVREGVADPLPKCYQLRHRGIIEQMRFQGAPRYVPVIRGVLRESRSEAKSAEQVWEARRTTGAQGGAFAESSYRRAKEFERQSQT